MATLEFVKSNILLIAVAAVSGAMLLWPLVRRQTGGPWVDTVGATQLINVPKAAQYTKEGNRQG